jgi:signal transduction histidine kinase
MSVRLRFALLYSGAFLLSGLLILTVAFTSVEQVQHVGGGPVRTTHPAMENLPSVLDIVLILVLLVVLSVGIGWLLATRLLRPVRVITQTARDISASNLSRRLPLGRREDEFARLGETLNELFERLEDSFAAQRHFVANASHELRTPLTAERTLLQVALADPAASAATLREACEQVLALGARTERLIDGLLTLATGERGVERREPLDLAAVAKRVAESRDGTVRLDLALSAAPASGEPRLAESLIANLVDNAIRYNVPGGWVSVRTGVREGGAIVSVSNSGPVVPAEEVDRIFEPFQRLGAERVWERDEHGHGLGLAIVRAIADTHGASVTAAGRATGGLDVVVVFPKPLPCRYAGHAAERGDLAGRAERADVGTPQRYRHDAGFDQFQSVEERGDLLRRA